VRKYFGTDGIRGKVGVHPITPEFAMKLGWATGRVLARNGDGPVIIGKDTRLSGYMFESALESGLSAAGVDIRLLGPMPTPGIAFLTKNTRAQAGIVISASHNPFGDNGFKLFSNEGYKLGDDIESEIEAELDKPLKVIEPAKLGKAVRIDDAPRRYIEFCKSKFDSRFNLYDLHIVLDCANGASYHIAPSVLEELGAKVDVIGVSPDGLNINEACGATNTKLLKKTVLEKNADLGIALDGDGDRLIIIDNKGDLVDGDEILYIIAKSCIGSLNGAVVGTLMSNLGLQHAIEELDLGFHRARVGDRYVMDLIRENNLILGGESSGHIINLTKTTTGDGIISALQVLEALLKANMNLQDCKSGMAKYPQTLINVKMTTDQDLSEISAIQDLIHDAENELGEEGRVLLRQSGTEPLIRVMVEGRDGTLVDSLAKMIATEVESVLRI
jgi:phosphoglucosamine mutase